MTIQALIVYVSIIWVSFIVGFLLGGEVRWSKLYLRAMEKRVPQDIRDLIFFGRILRKGRQFGLRGASDPVTYKRS